METKTLQRNDGVVEPILQSQPEREQRKGTPLIWSIDNEDIIVPAICKERVRNSDPTRRIVDPRASGNPPNSSHEMDKDVP